MSFNEEVEELQSLIECLRYAMIDEFCCGTKESREKARELKIAHDKCVEELSKLRRNRW